MVHQKLHASNENGSCKIQELCIPSNEKQAMNIWRKHRWWAEVQISNHCNGYGIILDSTPLMTPAENQFIVPSQSLAVMASKEWESVEKIITLNKMPSTRMCNTAIDRQNDSHDVAVHTICAYGNSDLICYRATEPAELIARQEHAWDPILQMYAEKVGINFNTGMGIVPVKQPKRSIAILNDHIVKLDRYSFVALSEIVTLSGSLLIGLACLWQWIGPEKAWELSRIDEAWQREHWGVDAESEADSASRKVMFVFSLNFATAVSADE